MWITDDRQRPLKKLTLALCDQLNMKQSKCDQSNHERTNYGVQCINCQDLSVLFMRNKRIDPTKTVIL